MEKILLGLLLVAIVLVAVYFYKRSKRKYDVYYFITKFSNIPASQWTTHNFEYEGKHCALGFCGMTSFDKVTKEAKALGKLFGSIEEVWRVNDGLHRIGTTPKDRILERLGEIRVNKK